jgi:hypothetical protein
LETTIQKQVNVTRYYWLKWLGVGLSTYMLYTISAFNSAQMHWFSDGIAGGFMGFAIGKSVGEGWRMDANQNHEPASSSFYWYPLVSKNTFALIGSLNF